MQDSYRDFSQAEIKKLSENPLYKNLHLIQNALNRGEKHIKLHISVKGGSERRELSKKIKTDLGSTTSS